jgi:hypothetical protein
VLDRPGSVLNFCANNYLGLSNHPAVVASAKAALDTHGFGLSSVRFICGTQVCGWWWGGGCCVWLPWLPWLRGVFHAETGRWERGSAAAQLKGDSGRSW